MDTTRVSLAAGVLYLLAFIAGIVSIAPAVDHSEYLTKTAINANQIYIAAGAQLLMAIAYAGITMVFFPILKMQNESLAVGFLIFRTIAILFVVVGTILLLNIFALSRDFIKTGSSDLACYHLKGNILKSGRDLVNHVAMVVALCLGGILFYLIMLQSQLIPSWLSVWGLVGSSLAILASILVMIKVVEVITPTYFILNIPVALQEIVFAIWLIAKGIKAPDF